VHTTVKHVILGIVTNFRQNQWTALEALHTKKINRTCHTVSSVKLVRFHMD